MVGPMKGKVFIAFFLGLFSFVLFMVIGSEAAASVFGDFAHIIVMVIGVGAYFFVCQFLLSRGNPNALFKDWPVMLALGAIGFVIAIVTALAEPREVFLTQGLGFLIVCFLGVFAGAVAASLAARRKSRRRQV